MPDYGVPVTYLITLADAATALAYQAAYTLGVRYRPTQAAIVFNAPIGGQTPGGPFKPPGITIPWQGYNFSLPEFTGLDTFTIPGTGWTDSFGNVYPDNTGYWLGVINYAVPSPATAPALPAGIRRFICGFENLRAGEGITGSCRSSRGSSRTAEGYGYAYRNNHNEAVTGALAVPQPAFSYERFYLRVRAYPVAGNDTVWSCRGSVEGGGPTLHLDVTPTGTLVLYNQGNGGAPGTLLVTSAVLALNSWYRVDLYLMYSVYPQTGFMLALNGVLVGNGPVGLPAGLGVNQKHSSSSIGDPWNVSGHGLECDIDDWVNSSYLDLTTGSHIQLIRPTGFSASSGWTGDWRSLLPNPAEGVDAADTVASSTASAALSVTTDFQTIQKGYAAYLVSCYVLWYGGGGTAQLQGTTITPASTTWYTALTTIAGTVLGTVLPALTFVRPTGVAAIQLSALRATVEFIGAFGPEDVLGTLPSQGVHNAPYPTLAQNLIGTSVLAPLMVQSGVYSGNALGKEILLSDPAHWWWVRPLASDAGGSWWWSSVIATAARLDSLLKPLRMVLAKLTGLNIAGTDAQANAAAALYQWVVVCDPGRRFMLNGAFAHVAGVASAINPLQDTSFAPEALFVSVENAVSSSINHWFRGIGHAAANMSKLSAAETADVVSLGAGSITSQAPIHGAAANVPDTAYSAWRRTDVGGNTGWFDLVTWVGDGVAGTRSIACVLNGVSPLFAIVTPHNGASYFRDPSHLTTHSSVLAGTDSTTAIVGGDIDIVKVGITLNAAGIVYDLFVIGGLANPGGWSPNPTGPIYPVDPFPPVGPIPPALSPPPELPPAPPTPPPVPPGGGVCVASIFGGGT